LVMFTANTNPRGESHMNWWRWRCGQTAVRVGSYIGHTLVIIKGVWAIPIRSPHARLHAPPPAHCIKTRPQIYSLYLPAKKYAVYKIVDENIQRINS